jgi:hypothetical protein
MLSQKQFSILILISILCLLTSCILWYNITDKNEKSLKSLSLFEQLRRSREFNYINGLWMIPSGIMFICILLILELPSFGDIYKHIYYHAKNYHAKKK